MMSTHYPVHVKASSEVLNPNLIFLEPRFLTLSAFWIVQIASPLTSAGILSRGFRWMKVSPSRAFDMPTPHGSHRRRQDSKLNAGLGCPENAEAWSSRLHFGQYREFISSYLTEEWWLETEPSASIYLPELSIAIPGRVAQAGGPGLAFETWGSSGGLIPAEDEQRMLAHSVAGRAN